MRTLEQIEAELATLAAGLRTEAEQLDLVERDSPGPQLPAELSDEQRRRTKLLAAKARIEARRQAAKAAGRRDGPRSARRTKSASLSEPESRALRPRGGRETIQGYNVQVAADARDSGLIIAQQVSDEPTDLAELGPTLAVLPAEIERPETVLVDKGYDDAKHIAQAEADHAVTVLCPPRAKPNERPGRRRRGKEALVYQLRQQMRERLAQPHWRQLYKRRKATVEAVFARIKVNLGFTRFHCWGRQGAAAEWSLMCLAHNLRILSVSRPPKTA